MPLSKKRATIEDYLGLLAGSGMPILPYDEKAAAWHASERARLQATGDTPPFADGQIAAIAQTNRLILATRNGRDFGKFDGLRLENWFG